MNHPLSIAETVLLAAVRELFPGAERACADHARAATTGSDVVLGTIGFGGAEVRGAITLTATVETWRTLAPLATGVAADTDAMLCDMVGELANMLAGRFRNAFLRLGVEILVATPIATRGSVAIHPNEACTVRWTDLVTPAGDFRLRLDLSFADGFDFAGREAAVVDPNEQDLVLF